jgi:uncharacterized protein (DUF1810 family)
MSAAGEPGAEASLSDDPYRLGRFVRAQDEGGAYGRALHELLRGRKHSHWMWFVFPQLAGLGRSEMAQTYAISSLAEARAYLAHPLLGPRLRACADALCGLAVEDPEQVLGQVDALKLRSSMTLFARADPGEPLFERVLERYFGGAPDAATERLLGPTRPARD